MQSSAEQNATILGVHVHSYKNLRDIWLPWSDGIAVFGANGVGKSNLLEALAVLFGDRESLEKLQERLQEVTGGSLEAIVRVSATELPWAPDVVADIDLSHEKPLHEFQGMLKAYSDGLWWRALGVSNGADFVEGVERLGLPDCVVEYVRSQAIRPVIRYTLLGHRATADDPDMAHFRVYQRTLMGVTPPPEVQAIADQLPDAFAPLRTSFATPRYDSLGLVDLLVLPNVHHAPVLLQWLPHTRTSVDLNSALVGSLEEANGPTMRLANAITELDVARLTNGVLPEPDGSWWLRDILADAANAELRRTMPDHVAVIPDPDDVADVRLVDLRDDNAPLGSSGGDDLLDLLSAGERRWVDEALASAARQVRAFGARANSYADLIQSIDEDALLLELTRVADEVSAQVRSDGYLGSAALQNILDAIEPLLRKAARREIENYSDPVRQSVVEALYGLESLRQVTTVRVVDEPEAHLHARAQRGVAAALEDARRAGESVILATHSPQFLDLPGWQLVHLQRTPEGTTLSPLEPSDLDARRALAEQMGFTRGELLARLTFLLIVEGEHDRLMLETLYGDDIETYGIGVLRMHGTSHILATAELDFVAKYLDVHVAVLTDHTRSDRVKDNTVKNERLSDEERALRELRRAAKRQRREIQLFGLSRPDITAYLNPRAVAAHNSNFPGWSRVLREFRERATRPSFKKWLMERHKTDLRDTRQIEAVLRTMRAEDLPPEKELDERMAEILRFAATGSWRKATVEG